MAGTSFHTSRWPNRCQTKREGGDIIHDGISAEYDTTIRTNGAPEVFRRDHFIQAILVPACSSMTLEYGRSLAQGKPSSAGVTDRGRSSIGRVRTRNPSWRQMVDETPLQPWMPRPCRFRAGSAMDVASSWSARSRRRRRHRRRHRRRSPSSRAARSMARHDRCWRLDSASWAPAWR